MCDRWQGVVERRVEAGYLRECGPRCCNGVDRREVVRYVQWIQRGQRLEIRQQGWRHPGGCDVLAASMHDAVADRRQTGFAKMGVGEGQQGVQHSGERIGNTGLPVLLRQHGAGHVAGQQMRRLIQVLDLAPRHSQHLVAGCGIDVEEGKFQAGRPGVEREDRAGHLSHSTAGRQERGEAHLPTPSAWCFAAKLLARLAE